MKRLRTFLASPGGPWCVLQPADAARLLVGTTASWWIAGGWALDLFCGERTREHADLDIGVLRRDVSSVLRSLSTWEIFEAKNGRLTRLALGNSPSLDSHSLWCRPTIDSPWMLEVLLEEAKGDTWAYRREPAVRRPLSSIIRRNTGGLPFLAPEIQLLYKSKAPRARDEEDFARTRPLLSADARQWLRDALKLTTPNHHWLGALRDSMDATRTARDA